MSRQLVQMKLSASTIEKVEELKSLLLTDNRTQVMSEGVAFYLEIVRSAKAGARIIIENKDGTKERLWFPKLT